jgi:peptidoglycan/LPS O-acetylase OafA/YrhL
MMLVVYHASYYVPCPFSTGDPASWSLAGAAVRAAHLCWFGVPIFFVVSGYCIAACIDGLQRRPRSAAEFFTRRLRRIYPPLWAGCAWAVAVAWLAVAASPALAERCPRLARPAELSAWSWAGNLLAAETWQHHLTGSGPSFLMRNTWTLCFEEQFYLICGLLLAVCARRFFLGAAVVTACALACRHAGRPLGLDLRGTFLEGHWLAFAAGILLFHHLNRASPAGRRACLAALAAGAFYAAADRLWGATSDQERRVDGYVLVACVFAVLLAWLRRFDQGLANAALARPLLWCGKRSYSIYLTHYPVVVALACALHDAGLDTPSLWLAVVLPACLTASLACGLLFYLLVERHFLPASAGDRKGEARPAIPIG